MKKAFVYLFVAGLLLTSCSPLSITTDYDKAVDFTKYKTFEYYGWAKESDKILNDLDKRRIETAFSDELYKRGLSYVKEGGDLIVTLYIVVQEKTETTANTTHTGYAGYGGYYGYGPGWGWGPGVGYSQTTYSTYNYKVGTLVIDIYDKKEQKLIFESIGSKTLDDAADRKEANIRYIAEKMMEGYPVKPSEK